MHATRTPWIVAVFGLTAVAGVAGDAEAACPSAWKDRTSPGTMCRVYGTAGSDSFFEVTGGGTSLRNASASTQSISCPLSSSFVSEHPNARTGFSLAEISLSGTGYSPSACGVHATSWNGTSTFVAATPTVNVSGSKSDFVWGAACGLASNYSSFVITCDIKPNSLVYKYEFWTGADA